MVVTFVIKICWFLEREQCFISGLLTQRNCFRGCLFLTTIL